MADHILVSSNPMEVTITVIAKEVSPISAGKAVTEVLTYTITDLLTRVQLDELMDILTPVPPVAA